MATTILCAGALARPHEAAPGSDTSPAEPIPAPLTDGTFARALRRARVVGHHRQPALVPDELPDEAWLRERFGLEGSVAACALPPSGAGGAELLVRPVHLHLAFDHLVLAPVDRLELGPDEAKALVGRAGPFLAEEGLRLRPATPDAWRLEALDERSGGAELAAFGQLLVRSARMATGRNVDAYQPGGAAARRWRQIVNLVQMAWHDHPVNLAREAAGRLPVNGLWLEGRAGGAARQPFAKVVANDAALAGVAQRAGVPTRLIDSGEPGIGDPRLWADAAGSAADRGPLLLAPAFWRDAVADGERRAWEQAWQDFDRWFATLLDASPRTARAELRVVLTGERSTIELLRSPADRWRPWRRLHLAALLREAA